MPEIGLRRLEVGLGLLELLVDLRALDLGEELPLLHVGADVEVPALHVAVDARKDRRIREGLRAAGKDELLPRRGRSYVLKVRGQSMIESHIDDGDYVVIQPQDTARDGEIVVAILDDNTATLKRFYKERDRIRLQPANSEMEPIYAREVKIQGKVIGVIRRLS